MRVGGTFLAEPPLGILWFVSWRANPTKFGFVYDSPYQSTIDAVYGYVVPWSEFPIVPSYPHCPKFTREVANDEGGRYLGRVSAFAEATLESS